MKSTNYQFILNDGPIAIITQAELDILACITAFEGGCDNVYIVDDKCVYSGLTITTKSFLGVWNPGASIVIHLPSIRNQDITNTYLPLSVKTSITKTIKMNPSLTEIPVCDNLGHICKVLRISSTPVVNFLPWHNWTNWHVPLTFLTSYRKIYISSLENDNLRAFYNYYGTALSVELLSLDNIQDALYGNNTLLVYSHDLYPTKTNKINISDLFQQISHNAWDIIFHELYIEYGDTALLKKTETHNLAHIIFLLDQGHNVINILNSAEDFYGVITEHDVRETFPAAKIPIRQNYFIPYTDNETSIKQTMMTFFPQAGPELPIIHNNKIQGLCIRGNHFAGKRQKYAFDMQQLHWELISDNVLQLFFSPGQKILLSSKVSYLQKLGARLQKCGINVVFFDNDLLNDYLTSNFDMLLYGSDVWNPRCMPSFAVRKLYDALLAEELRRYLADNNVHFYYFDIDQAPAALKGRTKITPVPTQPTVTIGGDKTIYTVYVDSTIGDGFHTVNGKRVTIGNHPQNKCRVHLFGPCTVVGTFTAKDEDTIASQLQKHINKAGYAYNVINYGNPGESNLSSLNRIMDTPMNTDDIVVLFARNLFAALPVFSTQQTHSLKEVFELQNYRYSKAFFDLTPHLNPQGNAIMAEYLFQLLQKDMQQDVNHNTSPVPPLADNLKSDFIPDSGLQDYLTTLHKHKTKYDLIGAIVMNCNPFTCGHRYLIEHALKQVDFLYIFVIEEDSSAFSFNDRYAMVKANCQDLSHLTILPSGRYMISRITFSAYFSKDELKEQTVNPANDVRIFGKYIAPCLNIKKRFVGEEPLDSVTRQYNEAMELILPEYGVELVEIPRLRDELQHTINATEVRKSILNNTLKQYRSYLTPITYQYIADNYERLRQRLLSLSRQ